MAPRLDTVTNGISGDKFLDMYRELRSLKREMETASANYQNFNKKMKANGVDLFALGLLQKLVKVEEEQATLHLRNLVTYADWTKANIGVKQGDMFMGADMQQPSEEVTAAFIEAVAEDQGYQAGRARESADINPHQAGCAEHAAWARGWGRGNAEPDTGAPVRKAALPKTTTRRGRNPAAETKPSALDVAIKNLDAPDATSDPAFEAAADEAAKTAGESADNVYPLSARRPEKPAKPATPKARAKANGVAIKAAAKLTGKPKVEAGTAF